MIKLHLKSNIDLRQAETVTVAFYKDEKILLTKTGDSLDIKQSRVDLELYADDIALWEPGRYIGIDVKATYTDGSELESNYVYRSFDVTQGRTEYWANTYFGDDEPHHDEVVDTSDATLPDGSYMLAPYTAYARGDKITGTMQKYGGAVMPLLTSIEIITPPTKTTYETGETIDLTGAVVKAFYPDGKPWEGDLTHPGGLISASELVANPSTAESDTAQYPIFPSNTPEEHLLTWKSSGWSLKRELRKYNDGLAYCALVSYRDGSYPDRIWNCLMLLSDISGNAAKTEYREFSQGEWGAWGSTGTPYTYKGHYYDSPVGTMGTLEEYDQKYYGFFDSKSDALDAMIGDIEAGHYNHFYQDVTIKWARPGDGLELTTTMTIRVK